MSGRIRLLDEPTINQIAAGEVIERPASVVKELVENSLDAGAKCIEVEITDGGLGRISVSDDGTGMSGEDVRMSVLRHATSKIRLADDLFSVQSLGFRGEALPSIASVSKFSLFSRLKDSPFGTSLKIEGGRTIDIADAGGAVGTVAIVSDLFFNTPARLKFMKSSSTESSHIHDIILRLALSRPDVSFVLRSAGKISLQTPGTGKRSDAIGAIYGLPIVSELTEVSCEHDGVEIFGFVSRPSIRKGSRQWQTMAVNGRVVYSRALNKAVDLAYQNVLPSGTYPLLHLEIRLPAEQVDVNVHPQKAEVRFRDERNVFRAVQQAVNLALASNAEPEQLATRITYSPSPSQFRSAVQEGLVFEPHSAKMSPPDLANTAPKPSPPLTPLGQISNLFIIATDGDSLYIVDQHAAHERILFDRLLVDKENAKVQGQVLLIPALLDLDPLEVSFVEEHESVLKTMGFSFDWVGPGTLRLLEIPVSLPATEAVELFRESLGASLALKKPDPLALRKEWIHTTACHMAVRAGQNLTLPLMQALLDDLLKTELPFTCPHGRPITIRLTREDLSRMFRRT